MFICFSDPKSKKQQISPALYISEFWLEKLDNEECEQNSQTEKQLKLTFFIDEQTIFCLFSMFKT